MLVVCIEELLQARFLILNSDFNPNRAIDGEARFLGSVATPTSIVNLNKCRTLLNLPPSLEHSIIASDTGMVHDAEAYWSRPGGYRVSATVASDGAEGWAGIVSFNFFAAVFIEWRAHRTTVQEAKIKDRSERNCRRE
jgi:hypothetical protein